jgi:hypothetical protein
MKTPSLVAALSFVVLAAVAYAEEIRVKKMTRDEPLDRSFVLQTNLRDKVVIDCQSFIQGLRIGEGGAAHVFLLDPDDCEALQGRIRTSLRRFHHHCIDVDADIRSDRTCY